MTCLSFNEISVSNLKIQTPGLLHPRVRNNKITMKPIKYIAGCKELNISYIGDSRHGLIVFFPVNYFAQLLLISGGLSLAQEANYMEQIIFVLAATLDISDKSLWMKILWLLASTMMLF